MNTVALRDPSQAKLLKKMGRPSNNDPIIRDVFLSSGSTSRKIEGWIGSRFVGSDNERCHWRVNHRRLASQRDAGELLVHLWMNNYGISGSEFYKILFMRIGKKIMDRDNLGSSMKGVQDGICRALGVDDGNEKKVKIEYDHKIGSDAGVEILIEIER